VIAATSLHALCDRYLKAQLAGDRREAVRIVVEDGLGSGAGIVELQAQVIQAAQDEIGGHALRWANGLASDLGVATAGTVPAEVIATARRLVGLSP
jgi:hypothetical protein